MLRAIKADCLCHSTLVKHIILSVCSNHPYRPHVLVVKASLPDHTWVHVDIFYSFTDKHLL